MDHDDKGHQTGLSRFKAELVEETVGVFPGAILSTWGDLGALSEQLPFLTHIPSKLNTCAER